jgi:acetyl-CoA carboxylase carboxyl transferase subunit alpha
VADQDLSVIDRVIAEPIGGAHRNRNEIITAVGNAIEDCLDEMRGTDGATLRLKRRDKFLEMGQKGLS